MRVSKTDRHRQRAAASTHSLDKRQRAPQRSGVPAQARSKGSSGVVQGHTSSRGGRVHADGAKADRPSLGIRTSSPHTPSVAASAAFHAFLRRQNTPYVAPSAASGGHVSLFPKDGDLVWGESRDSAPPLSAKGGVAAAVASVQGEYKMHLAEHARDETIFREWSLRPPASMPATEEAAARGATALLPRTETDTQFLKSQHASSPQQYPRRAIERRRRDGIERARLNTARQLSQRHQQVYQRDFLHAYQLLKKVEGDMFYWNQQRRRRGQHDVGQPHGASPVNADGTRGSGPGATTGDMDAADARFFEYAGQIQRTLHQLTPQHFDAMRGYRLRHPTQGQASGRSSFSSSATTTATTSPSTPLLHTRLLWRLLHLTQLFYSIGRQASLPRSAVQSYVQSANCAYGIREVLRVLGEELAVASTSLSTPPPSSSSSFSLSSETPFSFSQEELFQIFYAVLCIPSEDAPGVPLYTPATACCVGSAKDTALLRFQRDCVATAAVASRMPLEEWCVRWWCHVYDQHNVAAAGAATDSIPPSPGRGEMHALLTVGQAMDVVRAALYATVSTDAAATLSPSTSSPTRSSAPSPFTYFETPPRGVVTSTRRKDAPSKPKNAPQRESGGAGGGSTSAGVQGDNSDGVGGAASHLHREPRRYRPHLIGALGGDRTALRIPYHLGQRFVTVFLRHLLSSSSSSSNASAKETSGTEESADSSFTASMNTNAVEAGMQRLLSRPDRDAVRDVALLCTAILYFEVFSTETATFMARAAPLCREQVELLSGHEISCVLLAYATLQRWERRTQTVASASHPSRSEGPVKKNGQGLGKDHQQSSSSSSSSRNSRDGDAFECVRVQSASAAAAARKFQEGTAGRSPSPSVFESRTTFNTDSAGSEDRGHQRPSTGEESSSSSPPSSTPTPSWHLFYVTLGSRAGQLGDVLTEEDVTRVLRAMELVNMEHEDLRSALESSLRMRNLGRRMLYET